MTITRSNRPTGDENSSAGLPLNHDMLKAGTTGRVPFWGRSRSTAVLALLLVGLYSCGCDGPSHSGPVALSAQKLGWRRRQTPLRRNLAMLRGLGLRPRSTSTKGSASHLSSCPPAATVPSRKYYAKAKTPYFASRSPTSRAGWGSSKLIRLPG